VRAGGLLSFAAPLTPRLAPIAGGAGFAFPTATPASATAGAVPARQTPPAATRPTRTSSQSVIERIVEVVPAWLWLVLAGAVAVAAAAATAAFISTRRAHRQAEEIVAVSAAALTDPLTGALNRRGFIEAAERELARARRYKRQFALAYVDVRGLKGVNDSEGHSAGDRLLREAVGVLNDSARADDVVGRLGGDELGVLLGEIGPVSAATVTRRIRANLERRRPAVGLSSPWDLTIGTATFPKDGESIDELLRAADRRLYKQRGIALP